MSLDSGRRDDEYDGKQYQSHGVSAVSPVSQHTRSDQWRGDASQPEVYVDSSPQALWGPNTQNPPVHNHYLAEKEAVGCDGDALKYPIYSDPTPRGIEAPGDFPLGVTAAAERDPPPAGATPARYDKILGLKRRTFFIVLTVMLIVVAAAVGGGVGGAVASKSSSSSEDNPSDSNSPTS